MSGRWLVTKLAAAVVTLIFVLTFNFFLFRIMGDPTAQLARLPRATPQEIQALRHHYGIDRSLPAQFVQYVKQTLTFDLGTSQNTREPVSDAIRSALPWTVLLVGSGTLLATLLGSWIGVVGATRRGTNTDSSLLGFSLFTYAAPEYWLGIILILVFAVAVPILPAGLQSTPGEEFSNPLVHAANIGEHLVLPGLAMTLSLLGQYFLIMRSSMVDVLTEDFITVKRATGMPWNRVVSRHAVPNALLPLVTLSAIQFGGVIGGAVTIETLFSWPGLGDLGYTAIQNKDFPVLQGTFLIFSVGVIVANLIADALYFVLDPRVQTA